MGKILQKILKLEMEKAFVLLIWVTCLQSDQTLIQPHFNKSQLLISITTREFTIHS